MYEKLDRLRADVERLKERIEDDRAKLKAAEVKLKEAENAQILADVGAMRLSPEQLAQFLQYVQNGQLNRPVFVNANGTEETRIRQAEDKAQDEYESEENEDED